MLFKDRAAQLATDPKNADSEIINHPEIKALMKEKNNRRVCWECFLHNCFLKQTLSRKHKIKKRFLLKCKGKYLKFKDLNDKTNVSKADVDIASASVSSSKPFDENSVEELNRLLEEMDAAVNNDNSDFELQNYTVNISSSSSFTRDMIPSFSEWKKTKEVSDKHCILCHKQNMDLDEMLDHLANDHDIFWGYDDNDEISTFEEWVEAYNKTKEHNSEN